MLTADLARKKDDAADNMSVSSSDEMRDVDKVREGGSLELGCTSTSHPDPLVALDSSNRLSRGWNEVSGGNLTIFPEWVYRGKPYAGCLCCGLADGLGSITVSGACDVQWRCFGGKLPSYCCRQRARYGPHLSLIHI